MTKTTKTIAGTVGATIAALALSACTLLPHDPGGGVNRRPEPPCEPTVDKAGSVRC